MNTYYRISDRISQISLSLLRLLVNIKKALTLITLLVDVQDKPLFSLIIIWYLYFLCTSYKLRGVSYCTFNLREKLTFTCTFHVDFRIAGKCHNAPNGHCLSSEKSHTELGQ